MRAERLATGLLLAALAIAVARTAWVCDDAFVTLRTVDHFVHGRGLGFNALERVQGYTHPLWMLLLAAAYAVTGEPWLTAMALGAGFTAVALGLLARAPSPAPALALLLGSKAFVDFATSGLENPLLNALLAGFVLALPDPGAGRAGDPRAAVLLAALVGTTRLDALLLVAPALLPVVARSPRALLWAWPLPVWHGFALVYYGDPLPNTAHAKLATGAPVGERVAQGLRWLRWNLAVDPVTVLGGAAAVAAALRVRPLLGLGAALYVAYAVAIGGDFMAGRFLVAPLFVGALALASLPGPDPGARLPRATVGAVALALLGLLPPKAPLRSGPGYTRAEAADGVVDERGYYWRGTGLLAAGRTGWAPTHEFWRDGRRERGPGVVVKSVIGMYGFAAGPDKHVVDRLGLTDPLLARLPAEPGRWRPGHVRRAVPEGYPEAALTGGDLADPAVDALWRDVRLVSRGPLFTRARAAAAARLLVGASGPVR